MKKQTNLTWGTYEWAKDRIKELQLLRYLNVWDRMELDGLLVGLQCGFYPKHPLKYVQIEVKK